MATYFIKSGDNYTEISVDAIKTAEKLIPDADLMALKGSNDSKIKKLEEDLAAISKEKDSLLTRATTAELASEEVKKQLEPLQEAATKAATLETELTALREKQSAAETQLLSTKRADTIKKLNLTGDKAKSVESMSLSDIESLERTLELVGVGGGNNNSKNGNFDRNNGGGGQTPPKSSFETIRDAIANNDPGLRHAHGNEE